MMGVSSDAYLLYGMLSASDDGEWLEGVGGHEEAIDWQAEVAGFCAKAPPFSEPREAWSKARDEWSAARLAAVTAEFGAVVSIGHHCSDGYPMPYISTEQHTSWRGYSTKIAPEMLQSDPAADAALARVAAEIGGEWSEPGWHLVSWMG